jgi:hypothetical protein
MIRQFLACLPIVFCGNSATSQSMGESLSATPAFCFARTYQAAHFEQRPDQRVKTMALFQHPNVAADAGQIAIGMQVTFVDMPGNFVGSAMCVDTAEGMSCEMTRTAGKFALDRGDDGAVRITVASGGITLASQGTSSDIMPTATTPKVFLLKPAAGCQS